MKNWNTRTDARIPSRNIDQCPPKRTKMADKNGKDSQNPNRRVGSGRILNPGTSGSIADDFITAEAQFSGRTESKPHEEWQTQKGRSRKNSSVKPRGDASMPSNNVGKNNASQNCPQSSGLKEKDNFKRAKLPNCDSRPSTGTNNHPSNFKNNEHDKRSTYKDRSRTRDEQGSKGPDPNTSSHRPRRDENRTPYLSFTKLQQISAKDSTDIIRTLANSRSGLDEFLKEKIKPDHMYLIIKILSKLTASDWEENKEHVLIRAATPEFFKKLAEFVMTLATDEQNYKRKEEMEHFFENLLIFFQSVMNMLPSVAADHLTTPLRATRMAMNSVTEFQNVTISTNLQEKMKQILSDFEERRKEKEEREKVEREERETVYPRPLGSITNIPLYPRPEDIANNQGAVPPNKIKGPYNNVEHYLDVQFRLLREDFIGPVRQGINEYRGHCDGNSRKKRINNIRIYPRVKFLKPKVIEDKVGYDVCFDPDKKLKVNWEQTKRFIFGSLLLFTTDKFHSFFIATVVKRDLNVVNKDRVVTVILGDTKVRSQDILAKEFVMAESEVYFEPYYNVLKALQKFNNETFPMKRYLVYVDKNTRPPAYTKNGGDCYTISGTNNVTKTIKLFENNWPSCHELGFDNSQINAFKAALTNDLAVIQGPPGTGKTFLGLKVAEALLQNSAMWNYGRKSPILVICYTNHALDQFLEGIVNLTNNIVRIGGRSKSEVLEPFNLKERRKSVAYYSANHEQAALLRDLKRQMSEVFENIKILQDNIEHLDLNEGILSVKTLQIVMRPYHLKFFQTNDDLLQWLMFGVTRQMDPKEKLISTDDKEADVRQNRKREGYGLDSEDFENIERLKEVLFDSLELEESNNSPNSTIQLYFTCTLDEIQKKLEEFGKVLDDLPNSELPRGEIQLKMREASAAASDLKLIYAHFQQKLKNTSIPEQMETNRVFEVEDVNSLNSVQRWILYKSWIEFLKSGFFFMIGQLEERYRSGARRYEEVRQFDDLRVVQQADVIGITTSTAARLQAMLRELRPKIVIVEEAAEVLEAHIVASLSVHCQHLILIGDHKQLRPSPSNHRLEVEAHLGVSLFERLIMNGVAYHTLTTQHRMKPCISQLLVPTVYPTLDNHHSTQARAKIRGMDKDLFFMTHDHSEQEVNDIMSKRNPFEAKLIMTFARHLLLQGYRPDEITVLATYKGQMYLLKEEQRRLEISPDLLVTVVDNFQGEENRIILLSLVRSNSENRIGFLKTENRVCVALSRARDGLYVFGNMDCLTADSVMWQKIKQSFEQQHAFGPALILRCETHRAQITRVLSASDFLPVAEGGCTQLCGETLECGHNCKSLCHVSKDRHKTYRCSEPCLKFLCTDRHRCAKKCYQECGQCNLPMRRTLDCGHQIVLPCYHEYNTIQCKQLVPVKFDVCNHEINVECFREKFTHCPVPCPYRLEDCGHACVRTCHVQDDPDHLQYKCEKPCARQPLGCRTEGHTCRMKCHEPCQPCRVNVVRPLECGHTITVPCTKTGVLCQVPCTRILACGHPCPKACFEECGDCPVKVEKIVPLCGHKVKIACSETATKQLCRGKCSITLSCGHKCGKKCKEICSREDCVEPVEVMVNMPCGHRGAMVPCNMAATINQVGSIDRERVVRYCNELCLAMLKCGHRCSGTCGQCMQGRIHKVCDEDCNNTLICGHSCPVPCREACPPCEKKCQNQCVHSKCSKKCGEPCVPCNEPCLYQCPHLPCSRKCGQLCDRPPCDQPCLNLLTCRHLCVGFCGEPCPPCRQCEPHHYEEFFYTGEETEDDTRWVLLNDCKHVVDSVNMERWLNRTEDKDENDGITNRSLAIQLKTCPKCSPTDANRFILTTLRYMNLVKTTFMDIQAVKVKVFGEIKKIREERKDLLKKIEKMKDTEMGLPGLDGDGDLLTSVYIRLEKELPLQKNQRRNEIDTMRLQVLHYMAKYLENMRNRRKTIWKHLNDEARQKMCSKINMLTGALLQRKKNITKEDVDSFNLEMERIIRFGDLLILWSSGEFKQLKTNTEVSQCYQRAEDLVNQFLKYDHVQDARVAEAIDDLRKVIKSNASLSADEITQIRAAMAKSYFGGSAAQGHWFKCPNGHIYTITECGGATQTAKCPVDNCGQLIGGENHRYLSNVRLATEMDGASRPAWSSGYDMRNFDLNNLH